MIANKILISTSLFTDLTKNNYYIFSNGFYVTISLIALVALLTPKLYKHYYYKIFAIITWFLLIGSLSQYFDSAFNGFSLPQRRWVYFLVLSTSGLIALYIHHLSELTMKQFLFAAVSVFIAGLCRYIIADNFVDWMVIALIIIVVLEFYLSQIFTKTTNYYVIVDCAIFRSTNYNDT